MIRRAGTIVVLLALIASGCRRSNLMVVTGAPDALKKKGSAKVTMTSAVNMAAGGQDLSFETVGEGVFQFDPPLGRMMIKLAESSPFPAPEQEMFVDGTFVYINSPVCPSGGLGGKPYVRFDSAEAAGLDPESVGSQDPANILEMLRGAGEVEEAGTEEVRGVSTTHYRVTIDVDKALENVSDDRREALKVQLKALGEEGLSAEVWIDDDGLPRRFRWEFRSEAPAAFEMTMTLEFFDYGTDVDVQIPSEDQVFPLENPRDLSRLCFASEVPSQAPSDTGY